METLSAIPIKTPYIDKILNGTKTWEIRSRNTRKIGPVALIRSGSGTVVGTAIISKVVPVTHAVAQAHANKMGLCVNDALTCVGLYAWVLEKVVFLKTPVPYKHPSGAVTWVTLDASTSSLVKAEAKRSVI